MNQILILLLIFSFNLFANDKDLAKVTLVRTKVIVNIKGKNKTPMIGDSLPLDTIVSTKGMGILEFKYKSSTYRVNKNSTMKISEAINSKEESDKTNTGGVRAETDTKKENYTLSPAPKNLRKK